MPQDTRNRARPAALALACLTALLLLASPARAFPHIDRWWQYDPQMWSKTWHDSGKLRKEHHQWHKRHKHYKERRHTRLHKQLARQFRRMHFHEAVSTDRGDATWYDAKGATGACGDRLRGFYAASRTLPCGALVSVRTKTDYVFVTILDRGPYGKGRIIDLAPRAFKKLDSLSTGVINVKATHLLRKNGTR